MFEGTKNYLAYVCIYKSREKKQQRDNVSPNNSCLNYKARRS